MKKLTFILLIALSTGFLFAESLDPKKLSDIKSVLSGTRHLENSEKLKAELEFYAADPSPYLIAVVQDPNLRVYVKTRAIKLLQFYPSETNSKFLESKIAANNEHTSVRKFAIQSYAISQKGQTSKVQGFLGKFRTDSDLGPFVDKTLKETNFGSKSFDKNPSSSDDSERSRLVKPKK